MASVQWSIDMAYSLANVSRGQGTRADAVNIAAGYVFMGLSAMPGGGAADDAARMLVRVPGRVQSRINISNAGWAHVLARHFSGTGSRFGISQAELRALLGSRQVVGSPVVRALESADGTRFVRQLDIGQPLGVDKFTGAETSTLTVLTDEFGNLVSAFPGILR